MRCARLTPIFTLQAAFPAACVAACVLFASPDADASPKPKAKTNVRAEAKVKAETPPAPEGEPASPAWTYSGKNGPRAWGSLSEEYRTCAGGPDQSPIDLRDAGPGEGDKLRFDTFATPLVVVNSGHGFHLPYESGSSLLNGRGRHELVRIDVHTPSEHTLAGKAFPMELQLVHRGTERGDEGLLTIVSVFVKLGRKSAVLDAVAASAPAKEGAAHPKGLLFNATAFLPRLGGYFYYPGSLTTPPCTEGVSWQVLKEPIEASKEQIEALRKPFKNNARPVQPLRDRVLREM